MWLSVCIALLCILIPSAYTQGRVSLLKPPECGQTNVTTGFIGRIIGGQPAKLGNWPWMTALGYRTWNPNEAQWACGGALISDRHVLTAAHCIMPELYLVRCGVLNLENNNDGAKPVQVYIQKKIKHPAYNPRTIENDIAILILASVIRFSSLIHPICIPHDESQTQIMDKCKVAVVAGWGMTGFPKGSMSSKLMQLEVPMTTEEKCKQFWVPRGSKIDKRVVCAGYPEGGRDSCKGDSGGPLMFCDNNVPKTCYSMGIVSFGMPCAHPGAPTVYTRTSTFVSFIKQAMLQ